MRNIYIAFAFMLVGSVASFAQNTNPKKDYLITINTDLGAIELVLFDVTPKHKDNFLTLTQRGFYNGTTFHRIIKDFMIQGGDTLSKDDNTQNDGTGTLGYTIPAEFVDTLTHNRGMLAAARMGDGMNPTRASSSCQFYIVQAKNGTHFLDKQYTVFGKVIKGMDVVDAIALLPKDARDRPLKEVKMTVKATLMKRKKIAKRMLLENK
jgi:cyclophilin family peptidyl-prolyl cis-trans isomerase